MLHRYCKACGRPIASERLRALPDTLTCTDCSDERPVTSADVRTDDVPDVEDAVDSAQGTVWG